MTTIENPPLDTHKREKFFSKKMLIKGFANSSGGDFVLYDFICLEEGSFL